jgi:ferrochelatase
VIKGLGRQGHKYVCAVPVAFTSDHIETLYEIDIEYREVAEEVGIQQFEVTAGLNDEPLLSTALAEIVHEHLSAGAVSTPQYKLNCAGCINPACRTVLDPVAPYAKLRDSYDTPSTVPTWP